METTSVTVRNIPAEIHQTLKVQATKQGRSLQAELWEILANAVKPPERIKPGDVLESISNEVSLTDEELAFFERDKTPAYAASFD